MSGRGCLAESVCNYFLGKRVDVRALLGSIQVLQLPFCQHGFPCSTIIPLQELLLILLVQVGSLQNATHEDARYRNTFDGLRTIVRNQGWRQLFAGVSINYIRVMLTLSSANFMCAES